jgi:hypothetical protein
MRSERTNDLNCQFGGDVARMQPAVYLATMSDDMKEPISANDLLKNSSLYREFIAEREEILRHKWIESEKAGRDIGFERALTDWIIKHRSKWRKSRQAAASQ